MSAPDIFATNSLTPDPSSPLWIAAERRVRSVAPAWTPRAVLIRVIEIEYEKAFNDAVRDLRERLDTDGN